MGHADGFLVDCVETCENRMLFVMLGLVVFEEEKGKKKQEGRTSILAN